MMKDKEIVGVVHLSPMDDIEVDYNKMESWVCRQVEAYIGGGIKNVILQDQTPEKTASLKTVAYITAISKKIKELFPDIRLGIILESNDGEAIMYIAEASGAEFVRIKVFVGAMLRAGGIFEGAYLGVRKARSYLKRSAEVYADIYDKMGKPLVDIPIEIMASQAIKFGADKIILTGKNNEETLEMIQRVKKNDPKIKILIGGGVDIKNIRDFLRLGDGAIVSSCFISDSDRNSWDKEKIRKFMNVVGD